MQIIVDGRWAMGDGRWAMGDGRLNVCFFNQLKTKN
jgi:hypothetical protein